MAKAKTPPQPTGPFHLTESKESFRKTVETRIVAGRDLVAKAEQAKSESELKDIGAEVDSWDDFNTHYLTSAFTDARQSDIYSKPVRSVFAMYQEPLRKQINDFCEDAEEKIRRLESILGQTTFFREPVTEVAVTRNPASVATSTRNIFLVHGHDYNTRSSVKNVVHDIDLEPIILDDEANQGMTVIEKFEKHSSEASYAIIIATGDDEGHRKGHPEEKKLRARQNVIGEFFYFMAKLGRNKVVLLYEGGVELPSDIGGFCHIALDAGGVWKVKIAQELKAAGFDVDLNKLKL